VIFPISTSHVASIIGMIHRDLAPD
jgi:hypothetical protein